MAKGGEVLSMLIPSGGWVIQGDDFNTIQFLECEPITKAQFEAGFAQYDAWKVEQDSQAATDKTALLAKLGITADEAKLLLN
jgi:helix-turn-helix protein